MKNIKSQIHYTTGFLMIGSLLVVFISYLSKHEIPAEFLLLLVISIVVFVFTEKGGEEWEP